MLICRSRKREILTKLVTDMGMYGIAFIKSLM